MRHTEFVNHTETMKHGEWYKPFIGLIISLFLVGCQTHPTSTKTDFKSGQSEIHNVYRTQSSIKHLDKVTMAKYLCEIQSDNWNKDRVISETSASPTVIIDGVSMKTQPVKSTFYNPGVRPFDMPGCISVAMTTTAEKITNRVLNSVDSVIGKLINPAAAVLIAREWRKSNDKTGVEINNTSPNANIAVGTENAPATINQDNRAGQAGDGSTYPPPEEEVVEDETGEETEGETGEDDAPEDTL